MREDRASMIVRNNRGRRDVFGRLVHWDLVQFHRWLIGRIHTVEDWRLINMNWLPVVGWNWGMGS